MKKALSRQKNWIDADRHDYIRTFLLSEGFGFCLCISFIWGHMLDARGGVSGRLLISIIAGLVCGACVAAALMLIWARRFNVSLPHGVGMGEDGLRSERSDIDAQGRFAANPTVNVKLWLLASAGLFIIWLPVWLAYFPAVVAYDAENQLGQVISGIYSTHHPLLHTLILGGCMKLMWSFGGINYGLALYALLQMLFMAAVCGFAIAEAARVRTPALWLYIYGTFLAIFPAHAVLAISTTKDVIFSGLLLLFTLLSRRLALISDMDGDEACARGTFIRLTCTAAGLILFRNNSVYAFALALLILVLRLIKARQSGNARALRVFICSIAAGCAAGLLINMGLKAVLHADSGSPREALSVPIQQMARVYCLYGDELTEGDKAALDVIFPDGAWERYDEHLSDPVKQLVNMKSPGLFLKTWARLGVKYTGTYFDAWLYTTEGAWYIYDTSVNRIYGEGTDTGFGYLSTDTRGMPYGFEVTPHSYLPGLRLAVERLVSGNAFEHIHFVRLIFAPSLYVWIFAAYIYVGMVKRRQLYLYTAIVPAAIYMTILLGPAVLVRYMYPYMLIVILPMMGDAGNAAHTVKCGEA